MTIIKCHYNNDHIIKVEAKGHAMSADTEYDMVCAAISAITQTALLGLKNVVKVDLKYKRRDGYLYMELPQLEIEQQEKTDIILLTMLEGLKDLAKGYASYIKLEEEKDVY